MSRAFRCSMMVVTLLVLPGGITSVNWRGFFSRREEIAAPPSRSSGITNWANFLTDLLAFFALYLIISISLNLEMGYAGIPNFGKVLYFMGGAAFSGSVAIRAAAWLLNVEGRPGGPGQLHHREQADDHAPVKHPGFGRC